MNSLPLQPAPLDPIAARRRSIAVTALLLVAAGCLIVVEETWLGRARARTAAGAGIHRALWSTVDFPSALAAAVGVFVLLEVLRVTVVLARAGGASGLRVLTPPARAVQWGLVAALSAALASAPGTAPRGVAMMLGLCTAAWLRTMNAGPGVTLLCAPCVLPAIVVAPLHTALPAVLLVSVLALFFDGAARRHPLLACASGALLVVGALFVTGRSRLTHAEWERAQEAVAALFALSFVAIAYGRRAWRARARR